MSILKIVGKDDGGPHKPDPMARDFMVAGDVDLDTMCGFAQRVFSAIARELEE